MPTEQPESGSEADIIGRLAALGGSDGDDAEPANDAEPAGDATPVADEVAEDEASDEVAAEQEETETEAVDTVEVADEDGQTHKVPAKLKDSFLRWQDYTKKTQAASSLAIQAQDKLHFAEAKEQFTSNVMNDVAELRGIQTMVQHYLQLEADAANSGDIANYNRLRNQRDQLERRQSEKQREISTKAQQFQQAVNTHSERQWSMAVDGAKQRIGNFTPQEDAAMARIAQDLGFSEQELKGRFADPRFLQALHMAAKHDLLQKSKPGAVQAVKKAPPVVKPGATKGPNAAAEAKYREARQAFKKSGSIKDAQRVLLLRG